MIFIALVRLQKVTHAKVMVPETFEVFVVSSVLLVEHTDLDEVDELPPENAGSQMSATARPPSKSVDVQFALVRTQSLPATYLVQTKEAVVAHFVGSSSFAGSGIGGLGTHRDEVVPFALARVKSHLRLSWCRRGKPLAQTRSCVVDRRTPREAREAIDPVFYRHRRSG